MCLILFSYQPDTNTPLILGANRDEFFERPTEVAHFWQEAPDTLAGRDCISGGTWLGVTKGGRFAAVTNVREPHITLDNPLSRGELTRTFLKGKDSPESFLANISPKKDAYSGFNLLVGDFSEGNHSLCYLSNRHPEQQRLSSGIYGLSNHLLDTNWPKVSRGKAFLSEALRSHSMNHSTLLHDHLRLYLENGNTAEDQLLPNTGISYEREKALSAAFIGLPDYGTRTSTVVTIHNGEIIFSEQNYQNAPDSAQAVTAGEKFIQRFAIEKSAAAMTQSL